MSKEWRTIDKTGWGEGPWQQEPDKKQWVDKATGLDCLIVRQPNHGALCGYVGVPESHPLFGKHHDDEEVRAKLEQGVHGGLTFADLCRPAEDPSKGICHVAEEGRPEKVWWLGFDCAHAFDLQPGRLDAMRKAGVTELACFEPFPGEIYRSLEYVEKEVTELAEQIAR